MEGIFREFLADRRKIERIFGTNWQREENEAIELADRETIYDLCVPIVHHEDTLTLRVLYLGVLHGHKSGQIVPSVAVSKIVRVKTYQ